MGYIAFEISEDVKSQIKKFFVPKFNKFIGNHITYKFGVNEDSEDFETVNVKVVGYKINEDGQQVLVVKVNDNLYRPDGKIYHITWSIDKDKFKPVHSNNLLSDGIFDEFETEFNFIAKKVFKRF